MNELRDKNGLTEEEFLRQYDADKYPKPALTADVVIFRTFKDGREPEVLLIKRGGHPFLGCYAFPGGFSNKNEPVEEAAKRELLEETGIEGIDPQMVGVYSRPGRDPRGWTVSVAYTAVFDADEVKAEAGDDAAAVEWIPVSKAQKLRLAFDHDAILADALKILPG